MEKLLKLLEGVKTGWNYADIKNYVENNYTGIADIIGCEENYYYQKEVVRYNLTSYLYICIYHTKEVFGTKQYEYSGASIEGLIDKEIYTLYEHKICSDSKYNRIITMQESDQEGIIAKYNETKDCLLSLDDFLKLYKGNQIDNAIYAWTQLSKYDRLQKYILTKFASLIYFKAKYKRADIKEYNSISPFGGEDITYNPKSDDECFLNLMCKYETFFELDHAEFTKQVLLLLIGDLTAV